MADEHYEHGKMDITQNEQTFEGFVTFVTRSVIAILVFLILLYGIAG